MDQKDESFYALSDTGQVERLLTTIEFSKALMSAYDMQTLLSAVLERIKAIIPARNWSLLLIDPQTRELYFAVVTGVSPEKVKHIRLKPGEGIAGTVAQTGQPIFIPDADEDPRFSARVDTSTGFDTRSIIALPLNVRGEVIGVFEVVNVEDEKFFREKYLPHLSILADYVAIAVDNVRNLQKLEARTFIDEVTGFYNTRYLIHELDRLIPELISRGEPFSVVFFDLDNFKSVVDGYGHLRGTRVLGQVARVIHALLGPDDSLVRYGGDEFLILMPRRSQAEALEITRHLRRTLNQAAFLQDEGLQIKVTASYGIATVPEDATDREQLLLIADKAMFGSKARGRDRIMVGRDMVPVEN
ncbi:MAG: sensor domain-containing diguanylate cyclase [Syntrophobacterales bacterium]|jgi:diguanylate cyclase (GGDEF)-like protein|nr:sensor domain-containing diguanylate cyclase [Syntrophobacterales bacterium]